MLGMTAYDDATNFPRSPGSVMETRPSFHAGDRGNIGIGRALFQVCDSTGTCVQDEPLFRCREQSVLAAFDRTMAADTTLSCRYSWPVRRRCLSRIGRVQFRQWYSRVSALGSRSKSAMAIDLYDITGNARFGPQIGTSIATTTRCAVMCFDAGQYRRNLSRQWPKCLLQELHRKRWIRNAKRGFGRVYRDQHLDLASTWYDGVRIFTGTGGAFQLTRFIPSADSAMTVNAADFNGDGFDDFAVGRCMR